MTDQTPPTSAEDNRKAHELAEEVSINPHRYDERMNAMARAVKAHVPAPPESLADEIKDLGVYVPDSVVPGVYTLAERVEAVERENDELRERARQAIQQRDEARAEVERLREKHGDTLHDRNVLYDRWKIAEEKAERLRGTVASRANVAADLPEPASIPATQPWLVRDDQVLCLGLRCDPISRLPWLLVRVRNGHDRWRTDADVTLVRPIGLDGLNTDEMA